MNPIIGEPLERRAFIDSFKMMQWAAHTINKDNGWWVDRDKIIESGMPGALQVVVISLLGLGSTELSEGIEAVRKHHPAEWGKHQIKDTLVRELAGCVVRCMDASERLGLPLAEAIISELEHNAGRGFMHGGKAA